MSKTPREISKRLIKSSLKSCKRTKSASHRKQTSTSQRRYELSCSSTKFLSISGDISIDTSHLFPVMSLLEKLNFKYEVIPNVHMKENSFFMQDKFMNTFYNYYPEYICVDVLCEIPELDHSLVLFIGLDTNGHCEIVALGLIKSGNLQGFAWLYDVFKKHNPLWSKIEFITCNHNIDNREILKRTFPSKLIFFSFFHSMKAFKNDLSCLDSVLTAEDISKALQIFEQMFFVSSEYGYIELLKQMKQMPSHVFGLFKKNWHSKKELWALGLQFDSKTFLKAFNSFLLTLRRKLKPVISSQKSLENLIKKLHFSIIKLRKEWFQKFTCIFQSSTGLHCSRLRVVQKYSKCLTSYAMELINEQLNISENMRNVQKVDQYTYKVNGIQTVVSFDTCCCNFHTLMMLPCCHIFAVRSYLSLPLFVDSLRPSWVATKYQNTFLDLHSLLISDKVGFTNSETEDRFNQCIRMSHEMWKLLLDCNEDVSQERLEIFQNILKAWKSNFKIHVQVSEKQNDSSCNTSEALENLPTDYFKDIYGISLKDILDSENEFSTVSLCSESENDFL